MKKLYTVRDRLTGFGVTPGVPAVLDLPNDEVALRLLKGSCETGQKPNALNTNAEDKALWCIGEFDDRSGKITPCEPYQVGEDAIYYCKKGTTDNVDKHSSDAEEIEN